MQEKIRSLFKESGKHLSQWYSAARDWTRGIRVTRKDLGRVGYYAGLALLLALLGTASHAYRTRREAEPEPAELPRAALSVQMPTLVPEPEPTPLPVQWTWPLEGEVVGEYSPDAPVWNETLGQWQTHPALDLSGSPGEAVYACREGTVTDAWSDRLWGNVITVGHDDGYQSTYAGLNTLQMVSVGDRVEAGQAIGSVGQSAACEAALGWHLHFELTRDGAPTDIRLLLMEGGSDGQGDEKQSD